MRKTIMICSLFLLSGIAGYSQIKADAEHVIVFKEDNRFAGWPANYGIWSYGNEIVTGFFVGDHDDNKKEGHPVSKSKKQGARQARSKDGGKTWTIEIPNYTDSSGIERPVSTLKKAINFKHPDFAFLIRFKSANDGFSTFYYSYDRCKTWEGPFSFPDFGRKGIIGRTDYIINGKKEMYAFLASVKDSGREGWPFMAKTTDGGLTWTKESWIGPQPADSGFSIMPSTIRLKNNALYSFVRRSGLWEDNKKHLWLESFLSPDEGKTWYKLAGGFFDNKGNPPHMIRLKDGRIAVTYGYRGEPYGIRARISGDEGVTWSDEIIIRDDAANWDIGYPRTVQREDGKIVTTYYYNVKGAKERHIAASIWDPAQIGK